MLQMSAVQYAISYYASIWDGFYLELGVADGYSLNQIVETSPLRYKWEGGELKTMTKGQVVGFDSFLGLPEDWNSHYPKGSFSRDGHPPEIQGATIIPGWFENTLPKFAAIHKTPIALLHVDCDLYSSTMTGLRSLNKLITKDTIIVFDEFYECGGAEIHEQQALNDWLIECDRKVAQLNTGDTTVQAGYRATFRVIR